MFLANILVAGWISISCMFFPEKARLTVFEGTIQFSESIKLVGCLWFAIFLLSIFGIIKPERYNFIFLYQLIYKGIWLIAVCLPAFMNNKPYPKAMAVFFLIWVMVLPFVIDWKRYVLF